MATNTPNTLLFGFHAVRARLRFKPETIKELYIEQSRRDKRMQDFCDLAQSCKVEMIPVPLQRLDGLARGQRHQGIVAVAQAVSLAHSVDEVLDLVQGPPLLLILDGVTDPHNLGACLRVADAAGVHAVIAPKDRAVGLGATVAKVASGAAETVPYIMVTNLARTLRELKERDIWITGTSDTAPKTVFESDFRGPTAIVLGAEGDGMRRLTAETCDNLVSIPMAGTVESLNVSVASGVMLFEAVRQRVKLS